MDPPGNQSVDIYQIHRTPFFRRLHRKDSDDFERLKKAYESVRNFDDKPLQAQVKKIRLGKLLRRIKETFTSANKTQGQIKGKIRPKTRQQIRREELAKARQIGMDYSRQNLNAPFGVTPEKRNPLENWQREKSRLERRLEYGNLRSQFNRKRIQLTQSMHPQKMAAVDSTQQSTTPQSTPDLSASATKQRLTMLKKNLTRNEFMKFLVHCLSSDKPNPEVMKAFEEILQTKNDLYWDLVEAIDQRQQYIKRYGKFMRKLSNLALRGVPQVNSHRQMAHATPEKPEKTERKSRKAFESFVEEFQSKTNIKPTRPQSPEVYVRTYRYTDDDEFLPPPSESLLKIPESAMESTDTPELDGLREPKTTPTTSQLVKNRSNHSSARSTKALRDDPPVKGQIMKKFGEIIRETARKESTNMLTTLESAIKH